LVFHVIELLTNTKTFCLPFVSTRKNLLVETCRDNKTQRPVKRTLAYPMALEKEELIKYL
jgi:hypothetical protein